jgi:hypothetical protein
MRKSCTHGLAYICHLYLRANMYVRCVCFFNITKNISIAYTVVLASGHSLLYSILRAHVEPATIEMSPAPFDLTQRPLAPPSTSSIETPVAVGGS